MICYEKTYNLFGLLLVQILKNSISDIAEKGDKSESSPVKENGYTSQISQPEDYIFNNEVVATIENEDRESPKLLLEILEKIVDFALK